MARTPRKGGLNRSLEFRDSKGRFLSPKDRYTGKVRSIYRVVTRPDGSKRRTPVTKTGLESPEQFRVIVADKELFEAMPAAGKPIATVKPRKGEVYKAWNAANKIDKMKGLRGGKGRWGNSKKRRPLLEVEMVVRDGKKTRKVSFRTKLRTRGESSKQLYFQMNEALGSMDRFLYRSIKGKAIPGRSGRKVDLLAVNVREIM